MSDVFGCAINCIDGRAQLPVIEWVKFHSGVHYVDMITEPGADGVLSGEMKGGIEQIYKNLDISVKAHSPQIIAIAGHFDCVGNPVTTEEHSEMIGNSAKTIQGLYPSIRVVGLFVNEYGTVDVISDTGSNEGTVRSYL